MYLESFPEVRRGGDEFRKILKDLCFSFFFQFCSISFNVEKLIFSQPRGPEAPKTSPPRGRRGTASLGPPMQPEVKRKSSTSKRREGMALWRRTATFILRQPLPSTRGTTRDGEPPPVRRSPRLLPDEAWRKGHQITTSLPLPSSHHHLCQKEGFAMKKTTPTILYHTI